MTQKHRMHLVLSKNIQKSSKNLTFLFNHTSRDKRKDNFQNDFEEITNSGVSRGHCVLLQILSQTHNEYRKTSEVVEQGHVRFSSQK